MQAYVYSRHVAGVASDSLNANKAELLAENVAVLRSAWRGGGPRCRREGGVFWYWVYRGMRRPGCESCVMKANARGT